MSLVSAVPVNKLAFSHLSLGGFSILYYIIANNTVIYFLRNNIPGDAQVCCL